MIRKRIEEGEVDALGLSRLDIISCGLGAAVLLAIVFSLVKDEQSSAIPATRMILAEWQVNDMDMMPSFIITPPGQGACRLLPIDFNVSGTPKPGFPLTNCGDFNFYQYIDEEDKDFPLHFKICIRNPTVGAWKIDFAHFSQRNENKRGMFLPPITVKQSFITATDKQNDEMYRLDLSRGTGTHVLNITVQ